MEGVIGGKMASLSCARANFADFCLFHAGCRVALLVAGFVVLLQFYAVRASFSVLVVAMTSAPWTVRSAALSSSAVVRNRSMSTAAGTCRALTMVRSRQVRGRVCLSVHDTTAARQFMQNSMQIMKYVGCKLT